MKFSTENKLSLILMRELEECRLMYSNHIFYFFKKITLLIEVLLSLDIPIRLRYKCNNGP